MPGLFSCQQLLSIVLMKGTDEIETEVMGAHGGIAGFHKWFSGAFPTAVTDANSQQQELFDHVLIDMNQVLHVALRKANNEDHAILRIFRDLDNTLKRCAPRQSVVFAFDGSAPLAKLIVQRNRRENTARNSKYGMSALHLSPGTLFMEHVASTMEYYAFRECLKPNFRGVKFYISGASVPGEGELKCIDWVKHMCAAGTAESAVIVGGDADLVLQGLALGQVKNMFVCAPAQKGVSRFSSVWEVVRSLDDLFPGQSEFIRADLMMLVVLNGNDYLPKLRGVSFRRCFRSYVKLKESKFRNDFLVDADRRTFCWEFLSDLMAEMAGQGTVQDAAKMDRNSRYPTAGAMFKQAIQQGKLEGDVELQIHSYPDSDEELTFGAKPRQWKSRLFYEGKEYSWVHNTPKKKTAMHQASAKLLQELLPDVYETFQENEAARLVEEAAMQDDNSDDFDVVLDADATGDSWRTRTKDDNASPWANKEALYDAEAYLTGLLWNLQMYVDGYTPNFYWQYGRPYGPSCADMVSFIRDNPDTVANIRSPVSSAPPLPAAIACLCMMPMTENGKDFLPKRLWPLVQPGSALREALNWTGVGTALNLPRILRVVQEVAPVELAQFHGSSHARNAWKVIYMDSTAPPRREPLPPAPGHGFAALDGRHNMQRLQSIQVCTMAATSAPPSLSWSSPRSPETWQQPQDVADQPYKKLFGTVESGARVRGRGSGRGRGTEGRAAFPKSVAWRKKTSASRIRQYGRRERAPGRERGVGNGDESTAPTFPRSTPATAKGETRNSPPAARHNPPSSMCFGKIGAAGRPSCSLRL